MRHAILGGLLALAVASAATASASPRLGAVPGAADPNVEQVSGGCGPYGFRDYYGYCRQRRVRVLPPPGYYGCPPGFRPTPYGCRRYY